MEKLLTLVLEVKSKLKIVSVGKHLCWGLNVVPGSVGLVTLLLQGSSQGIVLPTRDVNSKKGNSFFQRFHFSSQGFTEKNWTKINVN